MTPRIALDLAIDGVTVLTRVPDDHPDAGKWWLEGRVALDQPNMQASLEKLREKAETRIGPDQTTLLILPDSQLLYTSLERDDRRPEETIRALLKGRTPYPVEDLTFDYLLRGDRLQVAVVALETLLEAETFAAEFGFRPVAVVANPDDPAFPAVPSFGPTGLAQDLLKGDKLDLRVDGGFTFVPAPSAPRPLPPGASKERGDTAPLASAPVFASPRRAAQADTKAPKAPTPAAPKPADAPIAAPKVPSSKDLVSKPPKPASGQFSSAKRRAPLTAEARQASVERLAKIAPRINANGPPPPPRAKPEQPVKAKPDAAPRAEPTPPPLSPVLAKPPAAETKRADSPAPKPVVTPTKATPPPAFAAKLEALKSASPKDKSDRPASSLPEAQALALPGIGRERAAARDGNRLGLYLTLGLIGVMAAVGFGASFISGDPDTAPTTVAEAEDATPPDSTAQNPETDLAALLPNAGSQDASLAPSPDLVTPPDPIEANPSTAEALPPDPGTDRAIQPKETPQLVMASLPDAPPSLEMTIPAEPRQYFEAAGWFELPETLNLNPAQPSPADVVVAALDASLVARDVAPVPAAPALQDAYAPQTAPIAPGSDRLPEGAEPLVVALAEGAVAPGGFTVFLGRPTVMPVPRPAAETAPDLVAEAAGPDVTTPPEESEPLLAEADTAAELDPGALVIATAEGALAPGGYNVVQGRPNVMPVPRAATEVAPGVETLAESDPAPETPEQGEPEPATNVAEATDPAPETNPPLSDTLVVATAEGALAPGGYSVVQGRPDIMPLPRAVTEAAPADEVLAEVVPEEETAPDQADQTPPEDVATAEDALPTSLDPPASTDALVVASAEGTLAPGGYSVVQGRPDIMPLPRVGTDAAATTEDTTPAPNTPTAEVGPTQDGTLTIATADGTLAPGGFRVVLGRPNVMPVRRTPSEAAPAVAELPLGEAVTQALARISIDPSEQQGTTVQTDLVAATSDGAVAPGGYRLVLGRPAVMPLPRTGTEGPSDTVADVNTPPEIALPEQQPGTQQAVLQDPRPTAVPEATDPLAQQTDPGPDQARTDSTITVGEPAPDAVPPETEETAPLAPRTLVVATVEGARDPDGFNVVLGRPSVMPVPRGAPENTTLLDPNAPVGTETGTGGVAESEAQQVLRRTRPLERPDRETDAQDDTQNAAPDTDPVRTELSRTRPQERPEDRVSAASDSLDAAAEAAQQAAAASLAQQQADAAAAAAAASLAQTTPTDDPTAQAQPTGPVSELALAQSDRPRTRPRAVERQAARIVTQRQRQAQATPQSSNPAPASNAREVDRGRQRIENPGRSVARAATDRNVLRLNQINLIGVYGRPSARRALVRLANGRYVKVEVGDRLDRGRVTAIGEGELSYQRGGRNVVLRMPRA
ncbi:MAG: hypothetical protein AAFY65_03095 [Pseudomonadota bacterium]